MSIAVRRSCFGCASSEGDLRGSLVATCVALAAACTPLKQDAFPIGSDAAAIDAECMLALPPDPPATIDPTGARYVLDLVFAVSRSEVGDIDVDGQPRYRTIGFDLDGRCTKAGRDRSCRTPSEELSDGDDGEGGRDNALGRASYDAQALGLLSSQLTTEAMSGRQSLLVRVRDYNGRADDDQVSVALYIGTLWPDEEQSVTPRWDGRDRWRVAERFVEPSSEPVAGLEPASAAELTPRYRDDAAYVRDFRFVARIAWVPAGGAFGPQGELRDAVVVGRLALTNGSWSLTDGTIAGRRRLGEVLDVVAALGTPASQARPCTQTTAYADALALFCPLADVRIEGDDPDSDCDGLSGAFAFEARAAQLGEVYEAPEPVLACEPTAEAPRCDPPDS